MRDRAGKILSGPQATDFQVRSSKALVTWCPFNRDPSVSGKIPFSCKHRHTARPPLYTVLLHGNAIIAYIPNYTEDLCVEILGQYLSIYSPLTSPNCHGNKCRHGLPATTSCLRERRTLHWLIAGDVPITTPIATAGEHKRHPE